MGLAYVTPLTYTVRMKRERVKYAAWLLLLLMALDLSTASICSAGIFPVLKDRNDSTLGGHTLANAQQVQNLDDDGCFCCCTHILPGSVVGFGSPARVIRVKTFPLFAIPTASPDSLFHPPKN